MDFTDVYKHNSIELRTLINLDFVSGVYMMKLKSSMQEPEQISEIPFWRIKVIIYKSIIEAYIKECHTRSIEHLAISTKKLIIFRLQKKMKIVMNV